jgi:hypothetical protein
MNSEIPSENYSDAITHRSPVYYPGHIPGNNPQLRADVYFVFAVRMVGMRPPNVIPNLLVVISHGHRQLFAGNCI